jgi:hypothetical protein
MVAVFSGKMTDYDPGYVQIGPIHQICGTQLRQFQNVPFCPISASGSNFNPRNTQCIRVVKISAFLDLEQN